MSSRVTPPAEQDATPAAGGSAFARWWGGWRVSTRMARRDIARHRWRSALIAVMIGLPVVLMVAGLTLYQSSQVSPAQDADARFGSAQALVSGRLPNVLVNGVSARKIGCPDRSVMMSPQGPWLFDQTTGIGFCPGAPHAKDVSGISPTTASVATVERTLHQLTGARAVPASSDSIDLRLGRRVFSVPVLHVDGADPVARGMVELTSGRWPRAPGEIVLTQVGQRMGLGDSPLGRPAHGAGPAGPELRVVGTAHAAVGEQQTPALVLPPPTQLDQTFFLLARDRPFTWADTRSLSDLGFVAFSRDVSLDPPPEALAAEAAMGDSFGGAPAGAFVTALLCLGLLLESCLVAGPAFAVAAQRQRRALALAAANGATRAQLRRTMLAEALVLGVGVAIVGTGVGLLLGWAAIVLLERLPIDPAPDPGITSLWGLSGSVFGGFTVPWFEVGIVLVFAVLAAVVSALVPARGLGRLEVSAALREDVVSPRPHRGQPMIGAGLVVLGTGAVFAALVGVGRDMNNDIAATMIMVAGGLALVAGALLLVPALLVGLGSIAAHAGVSVRLAARDASRGRGRTVPTVAAMMAGAILLSAVALTTSTNDRVEREAYRPSAPAGQGFVDAEDATQARNQREALQRAAPNAHLATLAELQFPAPNSGAVPEDSMRMGMVVPPGCTPARVVQSVQRQLPAKAPDDPCLAPVAGALFGGGSLLVASVEDATSVFHLDDDAQQVLRGGGVALTSPQAGATMNVVTGWVRIDGSGVGSWTSQTSSRQVATAAMTEPDFNFRYSSVRGVVTPATALAVGGEISPPATLVSQPDGFDEDEIERIDDALGADVRSGFRPETGYRSTTGTLQLAAFLLIAALIVVASLTATLLSMGEQRRDLATLAAVGAPAALRRRMAAVQAGGLAFVGTLIGLLVGAVPGVAMSLAFTGTWDAEGSYVSGAYVEVPWLLLLGVVVLVPLFAAGLAALFLPRRPDLTRRTS